MSIFYCHLCPAGDIHSVNLSEDEEKPKMFQPILEMSVTQRFINIIRIMTKVGGVGVLNSITMTFGDDF